MKGLLVILLLLATGSLRSVGATTLVVIYNPDIGVVLAADSSLLAANASEIDNGRPFSTRFTTACKIVSSCGFFAASAGLRVIDTDKLADVCDASRGQKIQAFVAALKQSIAKDLHGYLSELVARGQEPPGGTVITSVAVVGLDGATPVLSLFDFRFGGVSGTNLRFSTDDVVNCPGDPRCGNVSLSIGENKNIRARQNEYQNADPRLKAEAFVQLEIDGNESTRRVLPPISVLHTGWGGSPTWFRPGLCDVQ